MIDAVTLFYVTYVTFEVPCSLLMKRVRPRKHRRLSPSQSS